MHMRMPSDFPTEEVGAVDVASAEAAILLRAVAAAYGIIWDFARNLRAMPDIVRADSEMTGFGSSEAEWPGAPAGVDWALEAELRAGGFIEWELVLSWESGQWLVSSRVTEPGEHGPDSLRDFPTRAAPTMREAAAHLVEAATYLATMGAVRPGAPPSRVERREDNVL